MFCHFPLPWFLLILAFHLICINFWDILRHGWPPEFTSMPGLRASSAWRFTSISMRTICSEMSTPSQLKSKIPKVKPACHWRMILYFDENIHENSYEQILMIHDWFMIFSMVQDFFRLLVTLTWRFLAKKLFAVIASSIYRPSCAICQMPSWAFHWSDSSTSHKLACVILSQYLKKEFKGPTKWTIKSRKNYDKICQSIWNQMQLCFDERASSKSFALLKRWRLWFISLACMYIAGNMKQSEILWDNHSYSML